MSGGYELSVGPVRYSGWRGGAPFTLADAWAEVEGVGGARIYRPDGSVVLDRAGNFSTRMAVRRSHRPGARRRLP